jgi:hypothetical protein
VLAPKPDERVVFITHFERGFGLPVSDFFRDLLDTYDLQPHHIPANAVMILSTFAAFCEGFAGIEAFTQAWVKYFQLRKQVVQEPPRSNDDPPETAQEKKDCPMTQCGAATIMSWKGSDFPKVELLKSCKKWQKSFFYVKNTTDIDLLNLAPFMDEPPLAMKNWTYNPKTTVGPVNVLYRVKGELRDAGLTPQDLVACFISRHVSPLQRRPHKICQMSGPMDPMWHSTHELTPADILQRIKDICKSSQATFAWGLEPYSRDRPAPTVNPIRRHTSSCPAYRYLGRHTSIFRHFIMLDSTYSFAPAYFLFLTIVFALCRSSASRRWRTPGSKSRQTTLLRMLKIQIIGTSCPGTPVLPLPQVRPSHPGILLKTGVRMILMRRS